MQIKSGSFLFVLNPATLSFLGIHIGARMFLWLFLSQLLVTRQILSLD